MKTSEYPRHIFQPSVVSKNNNQGKLTILEYGRGRTISVLPLSLVVTPTVEVEVGVTSAGVSLRIQHRSATHEQTQPKVPIIFVSTLRILRVLNTRDPATMMLGGWRSRCGPKHLAI